MADVTRPATWEDVKRLASFLDEEGTRWALIGGYAIAAHGFVRLSEDVGILVDPSPENARRWIKALARLPDGARHRRGADPGARAGRAPPDQGRHA